MSVMRVVPEANAHTRTARYLFASAVVGVPLRFNYISMSPGKWASNGQRVYKPEKTERETSYGVASVQLQLQLQ